MRGYTEEQLINNRASVLIFGGGEKDRAEWAHEAAMRVFSEPGATVANDDAGLAIAFSQKSGVVYVPDVTTLSDADQRRVVQDLKAREERPKWVLGLGAQPEAARAKATIREDLAYWLQTAHVDLSASSVRSALKKRRVKLQKDFAKGR